MKIFLSILTFLFFMVSCNSEIKELGKKEIILKADREAPLGWVYLEIYKDTSFKFTSTGLIKSTHFLGKASIINDTIYFEYTDSIPRAGKIAVVIENNISYIAGKYPENLGIFLNKLDSLD
ncbi:MAG: hypothetical protein RQ875_06470 [Vicingaceae bacterium]|nr:hypothetical protein [Vicingaceae bacterium]